MPSSDEVERQLAHVRAAPKAGPLELIVARPEVGTRVVLDVGVLDVDQGLVGDSWKDRPNSRTPDNAPDPNLQLTLVCVRATALLCGPRELWPLTGDQLYVDMDVSMDSLPVGTHLTIGGAVIEVTAKVNPGCKKFAARFGAEARKLLITPQGLALNLRGRSARVVEGGEIRTGDWVSAVDRGVAPAEVPSA